MKAMSVMPETQHGAQVVFLEVHQLTLTGGLPPAGSPLSCHGRAAFRAIGTVLGTAGGCYGSIQLFSWDGMEKLYIGAPITSTSVARNSSISALLSALSLRWVSVQSASAVLTMISPDRWAMGWVARSR
jgi:hypothetical protein